MSKIVMTAAAVVFATSAFAQAAFYVVQDTATKRCTIVSEKPAEKTMVIVGDSGKVYTTRTEAETAMKTVKICETK
jgi:hypothetical protein